MSAPSERGHVPERDWDVLVIGAGPGGSATAGLLAQSGHSVLVLEREHFPRFHIGASLLPAGLGVMLRLVFVVVLPLALGRRREARA